MTREELDNMIEDEVSMAMAMDSTMREPEQPKEGPKMPIKTTADLSEEDLDEIIFYGGIRPEDEKF